MSPRNALITRRLLIASEAFGPKLGAQAVAQAIASGCEQGGLPPPELCPLETVAPGAARELLEEIGFQARMRAARAVVIAAPCLAEHTLAGSAPFEIATAARQAGVPAYALTGENRLDSFDARMLDLQLILQARSARGLSAAARKLAGLV